MGALEEHRQKRSNWGRFVGHKNGDLSIKEVKSYAKDAKGISELNGLV
ncbi:hypothetical protein RintRC_5214 [Richelia intracellularis]|nr:hypothetical protein RintRC_5214 [Richelia intracellularis]